MNTKPNLCHNASLIHSLHTAQYKYTVTDLQKDQSITSTAPYQRRWLAE